MLMLWPNKKHRTLNYMILPSLYGLLFGAGFVESLVRSDCLIEALFASMLCVPLICSLTLMVVNHTRFFRLMEDKEVSRLVFKHIENGRNVRINRKTVDFLDHDGRVLYKTTLKYNPLEYKP